MNYHWILKLVGSDFSRSSWEKTCIDVTAKEKNIPKLKAIKAVIYISNLFIADFFLNSHSHIVNLIQRKYSIELIF